MTNDLDDILEIFDMNAENVKDSSDYDSTADEDIKEKPSFDDLTSDLGEEMKDGGKTKTLNVSKDDAKEEPKEAKSSEKEAKIDAEEIIKGSMKEKVDSSIGEGVDDMFSSTKTSDVEVDNKDTLEVQEAPVSPIIDDTGTSDLKQEADNQDEMANASVGKMTDTGYNDDGWLLDSPSDTFKRFYDQKAEALPYLIPTGKLPFEKLQLELESANVDLSNPVYDTKILQEKMIKVQGWKNRVHEIMSQCNYQYYRWERYIELFHGVLARTHYEKPIIKQEGLVFEHLRDFEQYFSKLKSLHYSANHIEKNLASAFDCLSRQITISMQNTEPATRYERDKVENESPHSSSSSSVVSSDLSGYDKLEKSQSADSSKDPQEKSSWDQV